METESEYKFIPTLGNSFGTGWKVMLDNFLRLFIVVFVLMILTAPMKFNFHLHDHLKGFPWHWNGDCETIFGWASFGIFAIFFGFLALLYTFLAAPIVRYGAKLIFVRAVRRTKPDFELLISGFWTNYLHIILANLLVIALVVLGFFALIVPGIIIACRLAFTAYIVMDKKLDPIEAVELSWKLTKGHGWTIFFMGFVSFFIVISGLILMIIGVFPAIIWVSGSFATLYQSVLLEKEKPADVAAA